MLGACGNHGVVVGIAGSMLPALPGVPLVFRGLLVAAWSATSSGWVRSRSTSSACSRWHRSRFDLRRDGDGAPSGSGVSRYAIIGAALGTFGGLFLGIPALVTGFRSVGAVAVEMLSHGEMAEGHVGGVVVMWDGCCSAR